MERHRFGQVEHIRPAVDMMLQAAGGRSAAVGSLADNRSAAVGSLVDNRSADSSAEERSCLAVVVAECKALLGTRARK